jgi:methylenetetrahydrofolate--tRNA-(uracil-5-)-methyltransferase
MAGRNAAALARGHAPAELPRETAMGALAFYVSHADPAHYQPTNITFGIMPPLVSSPGLRVPKKKADRKLAYAERALSALESWIREPDAAAAARPL